MLVFKILSWYQKNKQRLSEKRKKRYAEDSEYRERALKASRRYRSGERTPPVSVVPPDAPISLKEAARRLGKGASTVREWRRKKYFPEPRQHKRTYWLTEHQLTLIGKLKECLDVFGKRRGSIKDAQLKQVRAFISANWN